jgi:hypothetical protein
MGHAASLKEQEFQGIEVFKSPSERSARTQYAPKYR